MGEAPPTGPWKGHSSGGTAGAYLTWEDLTVVLPSYTRAQPARRLIHGINGYAAPCRVLAIMGPSGSGKSTLLDALAGRLASNVMMQGTIKLNGRDRKMEHGEVAYVTQENTLLGTLTVRETIAYSANLRLPSTMTSEEVRGVVDALIAQMGLGECSDTVIGNWHLRGISGGERKRLSVALEVLTRPRVLFLDEPTSGLDSAAAFFVTATLAQMASDGMTVVCSVHQPSGEVFSLFGNLCLLSGGEVVYFGDSKVATQFFQQAGFECPMRQNPSDHFLRCINTDFDQVNKKIARSRRHYSSRRLNAIVDEELAMKTLDPIANMETSLIKARLVDRYMTSEYAIMVAKQIKEIHDLDGSIQFSRKGNQATWWKQLITLTRRSFTNMSRDLGYYWIRIVVYIIVSLCVGTVFFNLGTTYDSILARTSSAAFIFGFMSLMSMGGFPSFIEEMKVFYHERLNGHYGVAAFVLSNFISSIPFLLVVSTISSAITYYLVRLHPGFSHFIFFTANLYGCVAVVETIMMVVASFVPNFLMGIGVGAGIMGTSLLASGFMRLLSDLPKPFWRYPVSYMFYGSWALQGQYKNDMLGLEFDSSIPGGPKLKGEYLIRENFGVSLDHSKWIDLSIIFLLLLFYRLVFFLMIKVKERASPLLRLILTKVAYHQLQTNSDCKLGEMKGNIDF